MTNTSPSRATRTVGLRTSTWSSLVSKMSKSPASRSLPMSPRRARRKRPSLLTRWVRYTESRPESILARVPMLRPWISYSLLPTKTNGVRRKTCVSPVDTLTRRNGYRPRGAPDRADESPPLRPPQSLLRLAVANHGRPPWCILCPELVRHNGGSPHPAGKK